MNLTRRATKLALGHHRDDIHLFRGTEPHIRRLAGLDAPDRHLHERAQISRCPVLRIQHHSHIAIVTNGHSFSNIVC